MGRKSSGGITREKPFSTGGKKQRGSTLRKRIYPRSVVTPSTPSQITMPDVTADVIRELSSIGWSSITSRGPAMGNAQKVHHPRQIVNPQNLHTGQVVVLAHVNGHRKLSVIDAPPEPGSKWFKRREIGLRSVIDDSLADNGIIPYEGGNWNVTSYLIDTGITLSEADMELMRKGRLTELPPVNLAEF